MPPLCHAGIVGDEPDRYWDYRVARWVRYVAPPATAPVPEQPQAADDRMADAQEADVRSG